ncbi:MAG: type I restriction endonuclease subunit R [Tissierellia bacterium]|nr:type I restriction endonuclease subunit R [Tissierellia bacterium]
MSIDVTEEKYLEENLIQTLIDSGYWTYRPDLNNEEKLWNNLRDIIEKNNKSVLKDVALTDMEFNQVKSKLSFPSFFKAALALRGENSKFKVEVQREDASLGRIWLLLLDNNDIAGGSSVYQIINQYRVSGLRKMDPDSRFDVSLLINGLPLIHIELKSRGVGYMEAFNQIKEYLREGKFRGIYSACQMFVVTNGADTRYIAPANHEDLNPQFLSRWVDKENEPVNNYIEFAKEVLTIPEAHKLVSSYTVLDYDQERVILLRPYQIHAIKAVMRDVRKGNGGYVWHTTGSGKTLTSYKVAKNLLSIPKVDKSVFIVDRIDLDNQTTGAFSSYAKGDFIDVDDTSNINDLAKKLTSDQKSLLVTTIQKLNFLIKRYENQKNKPYYKKLKALNLVFVVDECHRAVSSEKQMIINKFFNNPYWYGFTGTPIFAENKKAAKGDLARTTKDQYGKCLHQYTVKHAILDKAVLGFQVEYKTTISEDSLYDIANNQGIDNPRLLEQKQLEGLIPSEYFNNDEHMIEVIDTIVNKSRLKFGLDKGVGNSYGAILTTSSIEKAQRYYQLFSKLKKGELPIKISDRVRREISDFPKVAITYSIAANQEETGANKEMMKESLNDYNEMFVTSFGLDNIGAYNANLNDRLARKKAQFKSRSEQIDLVIVVDRLLTGFDSPSMGILFMDRSPMTPQNLIQAFSRTNRLYDRYKTYGQIVTFQTPAIYKEKIEEAFFLYSNGGEDYIKAKSYEESLSKFENALDNFKTMVNIPDDVDEFSTIKEKLDFIKAFQDLDQSLSNLRVYSEFDDESFYETYDISLKDLEEFNGKYINLKEEIKSGDIDEIDLTREDYYIDIGYESLTVGKVDIDVRYLNKLMQAAAQKMPNIDSDKRNDSKIAIEAFETIEKYAKSNSKKAQLYMDILKDLIENPSQFKDKDMVEFMEELTYSHYLQGIRKLANSSKIPQDVAEYYVKNFDPSKSSEDQLATNLLMESADLKEFRKEHDLSRLKANRKLRDTSYKIARDDVSPYKSNL